jgi:hypothetical protein
MFSEDTFGGVAAIIAVFKSSIKEVTAAHPFGTFWQVVVNGGKYTIFLIYSKKKTSCGVRPGEKDGQDIHLAGPIHFFGKKAPHFIQKCTCNPSF